MRRRHAFTLLELLIVIAIIGVLVAILLPAIQNAREAARRTVCQGHCSQIGLAALNYEEHHRVFPPAALLHPRHSAFSLMLPFLEQQSLWRHYDFRRNYSDPANAAATATRIDVLICPSAPSRREIGPNALGPCDYTPITDVDPTAMALGIVSRRQNPLGVMTVNGRVGQADVRDGLSHTLLIVEDAGRPQQWQRRRQAGTTIPTGWASYDRVSPINLDGASEDGTAIYGPCAVNCANLHEIYAFHIRGANTVFADGHYDFLHESIDINVAASLVTRAEGEVTAWPP